MCLSVKNPFPFVGTSLPMVVVRVRKEIISPKYWHLKTKKKGSNRKLITVEFNLVYSQFRSKLVVRDFKDENIA
jgi:hypothetical protein